MKKILALLLALVMLFGVLAGCTAKSTDATDSSDQAAQDAQTPAESTDTADTANTNDAAETTDTAAKTIETLKVAFVPSREPQEIITATEPLKQLLKDELAKEGYDVKDVEITVGTTYEAVGEGLEAGTIDVGLIPGGTYVLYDDGAEVILTATRDGLSNGLRQRQGLERRPAHRGFRQAGCLLPCTVHRRPVRKGSGTGRQGQRR